MNYNQPIRNFEMDRRTVEANIVNNLIQRGQTILLNRVESGTYDLTVVIVTDKCAITLSIDRFYAGEQIYEYLRIDDKYIGTYSATSGELTDFEDTHTSLETNFSPINAVNINVICETVQNHLNALL